MPPSAPGEPGSLYVDCPMLAALEGMTAPEDRWFTLKLLRLALFKFSDLGGYTAIAGSLPDPYDKAEDRVSWVARAIGLLFPGDHRSKHFIDIDMFGSGPGATRNKWATPAGALPVDGRVAEFATLVALESAFAVSLRLIAPPNYDPAHWMWPALNPAKTGVLNEDILAPLDLAAMPEEVQHRTVSGRWAAVLERFEAFSGGLDVLLLTPPMRDRNGIFARDDAGVTPR